MHLRNITDTGLVVYMIFHINISAVKNAKSIFFVNYN